MRYNKSLLYLIMVLIPVILNFLLQGCGGGGGGDGGGDGDSTAGPVATVDRGADIILDDTLIGSAGGTIEGPPGSPIDGVSVHFPEGAVEDGTTISIGYNDGSVTPVEGTFVGPILTLYTDGLEHFNEPVEITVPLPDDNVILIPYYIDDLDKLHLMDIASLDPVAGTTSFYTFHASPFAGISLSKLYDTFEIFK